MKNNNFFKAILLVITLVTIGAVCLTACDNKVKVPPTDVSYTITYYDGNQMLGTEKINAKDTDIELLTPPKKEGYEFKGWYVDKDLKTPFVKSEYLANKKDISLYAKYEKIDVLEKEYTITFNISSTEKDVVTVKGNDSDFVMPKDPIKENYIFKGWYLDVNYQKPFVKEDWLNNRSNIEVYAKFEKTNEKIYIITFIVDGATHATKQVKESDTSIIMPSEPTKEGYTFVDWYKDSNFTTKFDSSEWINNKENLKVYAKFVESEYTIILNVDGGSVSPDKIVVKHTSNTLELPTPKKEGYTFEGWYTNELFTTKFNKEFWLEHKHNANIYAKFIEIQYDIDFVVDGNPYGEKLQVGYTENNSSNVKLPNPYKEGYNFDGWYIDSDYNNKFSLDAWIVNKKNITLYGRQVEIPKDYKEVKLSVYGKDYGETIKVYEHTENLNLPRDTIKEGYKIVEWYTDSELKTKFNEAEYLKNKQNITLYADAYFCNYKVWDNEISGINDAPNVQFKAIVPNYYNGKRINAISYYAFEDNKYLTDIVFEDGIFKIGDRTFAMCTSLKTVKLPNTMKFIGDSAFNGCENLLEISLPDSLEVIENNAFYGCTNLEKANLPQVALRLGIGVFSRTKVESNLFKTDTSGVVYFDNFVIEFDYDKFLNVTTYNVKDGTIGIADNAFSRASKLTNVVLPDSLKVINDSAFSLSNITTINIPDNISYIGKDILNYTPYYNNKSNYENGVLYVGKFVVYAQNTSGILTIKDGTLGIASNSFYDSSYSDRNNKFKEIVLPSSLKFICDTAFEGVRSLEKITITGDSQLEYIGAKAFVNCVSVVSSSWSDNIKYIGESAFQACSELSSEFYLSNQINYIGNAAFNSTKLIIKVEANETPKNWNDRWDYSSQYSSSKPTILWGQTKG